MLDLRSPFKGSILDNTLLFDNSMLFNIDEYNPLIKYNWRTVRDTNGNRQLVDAGSKPSYNATMYTGKALKFNGVDQSVKNIYLYPGNVETIIASFVYSGTAGGSSVVWSAYSWLLIRNDYSGVISVKTYDGSYHTISAPAIVGKEYTVYVSFDKINHTLEMYMNGVFIDKITADAVSWGYDFEINSYHGATSRYDGTTNNIIAIGGNKALTPSQIAYQYANPEKFLYRENGILKSKTLTQAEIDNVKVYMPCIESDGFVRDYANYTEGADFAGSYNNTAVGDETITVTDNGNSVNLDLTAVGTNTLKPISYWDKTSLVVDNTKYLIEITFANVTGSVSLVAVSLRDTYSNRDTSFANTITSDQVIKGVYDSKTSGNYDRDIYLFIDGSASTFKCDISVVIKPLTGIYAIDNYTNTMNQTELTTGLQTCFWKVDELGVPNELMEHGVIGSYTNGYIDTGYNLDLSKYHAFEMVYPIPSEQIFDIELFGNNFTDGLLVGLHPTLGFIFMRLYNLQLSTGGFGGTIPHIYIEFDNINKQVNFYVNGVLKQTSDVTISTADSSTIRLLRASWYRTPDLNLKLFNIHETQQDPAKLYADAQKKGLL